MTRHPDERNDMLATMGIDRWVLRQSSRDDTAAAQARPAVDAAPPATPPVEEVWRELARQVSACTLCGLNKTRTQTVFGNGDRQADLMIIGEAPGADEDRQGAPFVGRAGQLLTLMLQAIGLERDRVFVANILKCRPPGNRDPRPDEVRCCTPYLQRQIALVQPKLLMALGRIAAHYLLDTDMPLGRLRGTLHAYGEHKTPLLVTYHPAYLLRSPAQKARSYDDLRRAAAALRA